MDQAVAGPLHGGLQASSHPHFSAAANDVGDADRGDQAASIACLADRDRRPVLAIRGDVEGCPGTWVVGERIACGPDHDVGPQFGGVDLKWGIEVKHHRPFLSHRRWPEEAVAAGVLFGVALEAFHRNEIRFPGVGQRRQPPCTVGGHRPGGARLAGERAAEAVADGILFVDREHVDALASIARGQPTEPPGVIGLTGELAAGEVNRLAIAGETEERKTEVVDRRREWQQDPFHGGRPLCLGVGELDRQRSTGGLGQTCAFRERAIEAQRDGGGEGRNHGQGCQPAWDVVRCSPRHGNAGEQTPQFVCELGGSRVAVSGRLLQAPLSDPAKALPEKRSGRGVAECEWPGPGLADDAGCLLDGAA